jgi:Ni,Fe-hydrogenase I small subunit
LHNGHENLFRDSLWLMFFGCKVEPVLGILLSFLNAEEPTVVDLITDFGINVVWHPSLGLQLGDECTTTITGTVLVAKFL